MLKLALALIVKGTDEEAENLARLLGKTRLHVDGAFITSTYRPGNKPNEKVAEVAKFFNCQLSTFEWCNDFSQARNFNFSQVPADYTHILWLDADDLLRDIEKLRPTIEDHPEADVFQLFYLYAFDEWNNPTVVHTKSQVVKNDGCVKWAGALHEDLQSTREVKTFFVKGIDRIHLSNEERFQASKERNLEVATAQAKREPSDPRSYWNTGNSLKALGKHEESLAAFDQFLELSQSDDEKYIVRLRRAESLWQMGKRAEGLQECQYAIGLRPEFPDAYHLAGSLYLSGERYEDAIKMYLQGLVKKPPYLSILVYNPRDYDVVPMMNLAKAYFNISRPDMSLPLLQGCLKITPKDESLKKTIGYMKAEKKRFDSVVALIPKLESIKDKEKFDAFVAAMPRDLRAHPAVCKIRNTTFIKTEASGRDLVIYCGATAEVWNPDTAKKKGIGGSEEAVIWMSQLLSKRGWNVTVYNNCGVSEKKFGKVLWRPFWMWNHRDRQDVTILWRHPRSVDYGINSAKVYIDLHDVIPEGEFTPARVAKLAGIFVKSHFHRSLFPQVPDAKFHVIPNGIDPTVFEGTVDKDPFLLINTSSPDRSLSAFIKAFEKIKVEIPDATAKWAYGWGVFDTVHSSNPKMMEWKALMKQRMQEVGIEEMGRLSHSEIARLYKKATVFLYPSEFAEIDCISLTKAMAAGAYPITTTFSAMGEKKDHGGYFLISKKTKDTWAQPYQFDFAVSDEQLLDSHVWSVVNVLRDRPPQPKEIESMRKWASDTYDWQKVADRWHTTLCE